MCKDQPKAVQRAERIIVFISVQVNAEEKTEKDSGEEDDVQLCNLSGNQINADAAIRKTNKQTDKVIKTASQSAASKKGKARN